ncbi:hypothetical protein R9X47_09395 [Wukongibacter baidiensis]|uniref:hypothetical protein n=1 Tax=Wukongibacter baidiensis TaxID=1723361 RepID=UPI003D7F2929
MRKFMLILITICLLIGITTSFAEDKNTHKARQKPEQNREEINDKGKVDKRKELKSQISPLIKAVGENREKLRQLTLQSKESYKGAKNHVRKLIEEKDSLTDEQVEELKVSLETLKNWNKKIVGSRGDIGKVTKKLRDAKEKRNYKMIKASYEKIIEIQNSRIENLNKVIEDLDKITKI